MLDATTLGQATSARPSLRDRCGVVLRSALLRDSISYFGSKVLPGLMGLVSVPVFIRLIGLDQYGRFAVTVPLLMAVAGASSGWLAQGVLRFHPATGNHEAEDAFHRAVIAGAIATTLVTATVMAIVLIGLHYRAFTLLASLAFCVSLVLYTIALATCQAQLRPQTVFWREIIRSVGGLAIPVALVAGTGRKAFEFLLLGQALAYTIALLPWSRVLVVASRSSADAIAGQTLKTYSSGRIIQQLWTFGWAVGLWLLLQQALPVIDRWTIQKFASYSSAGVYASLYEVAIRSFSFLVFPLTQAAHPRIMRAWNDGRGAESYRIIRYSIVMQLIIFLAVLGGVLFGAHRITRLILGFDDPIAARMLPVLLVGGFLWQLALLLHKPLEIMQKTTTMLAGMSAVVMLNIVACFYAIPRFGFQAGSYILCLSACFYILFTLCMTGLGGRRELWLAPET